ncbi:serine/threonine protein kinase [Streptacidiphilus sp. MAP12-16]|uniref:serine/threonine protein kinase n=1 Tax=Streptacidiphilus sp. MAP12-16 TaxID=3156300 RepID=UPI0035112E55
MGGTTNAAIPEPGPGEELLPFLERVGEVFTVFDAQDSGCWSAGVRLGERPWFIKTALTKAAEESLARARALHAAVRHPVIVPLEQVLLVGGRAVHVMPWRDGQVLYHPTTTTRPDRTHPDHPLARFRALPLPQAQRAVDEILDAHLAVEAAGFVAVDLYDGALLYDFTGQRMSLCDLDEYRPGPFTVPGERLPGSARFMAPEEHRHGALITTRTSVHALGRTARLLLDAGDHEKRWRGTPAQLAVLRRATDPDPARRHPSVRTWSPTGMPPRRLFQRRGEAAPAGEGAALHVPPRGVRAPGGRAAGPHGRVETLRPQRGAGAAVVLVR